MRSVDSYKILREQLRKVRKFKNTDSLSKVNIMRYWGSIRLSLKLAQLSSKWESNMMRSWVRISCRSYLWASKFYQQPPLSSVIREIGWSTKIFRYRMWIMRVMIRLKLLKLMRRTLFSSVDPFLSKWCLVREMTARATLRVIKKGQPLTQKKRKSTIKSHKSFRLKSRYVNLK